MKRWIVVVAGIVAMLGPGIVYSFSLLSGPLAASFGWTTTETSWAFAMANFFLTVGCLVGGIASDARGPRAVALVGIALWAAGYASCGFLTATHSIIAFYLGYGVVGGFGCGMVYIAALNAVIRWFPKARGLGGGLVIMGFGLASVLYNAIVKGLAPFGAISAATQAYSSAFSAAVTAHIAFDPTQYLLAPAQVSALMDVFLASGTAIAVVGGVAALFLANPPVSDPVYEAQYAGEQATLPQMMGDARFYLLWSTLFLSVFGGVALISNMVPLMRELTGMPAADAGGLYALLAVCNGLGRLLWGAISDRIGRRATFVILFAGQSLSFLALGFNHEVVIVAIAIATLLLCYGGAFGTMAAFNADFFGIKHFGANYGMQLSAWGLAAVAGTGLASSLKDLTGSFAGVTQPLAIIALVAIFFPLLTGEAQRRALETAA